jgi:polyhydroxyalkanoate synthase
MLSLRWLIKDLRFIPIRTIVQMAIPLISWMPHNPVQRAQMNTKNVDTALIKRVAYNAVYHLPLALLRQFADWAENDCFRSVDLKTDYQAGVRTIKTPIMVISGAADRLVVAENTRHAFDLLPEGGKKHIVLGTTQGFSADYGHVDMVFGKKANEEVLPLVLEWVVSHDTAIKSSPDRVPG